jgi:integrase
LRDWGNAHSEAKSVSPATVNKVLGGIQAVLVWARNNGIIPDEVPWSDPFARMRLEENAPSREPWQLGELRTLFTSPVFTDGARPAAGAGEAAYWLPLLAMFTGARLSELAALTAEDVTTDQASGIVAIKIIERILYYIRPLGQLQLTDDGRWVAASLARVAGRACIRTPASHSPLVR